VRSHRLLLPALTAAGLLLFAGCDLILHQSEGEKLWRAKCADCHGLDGSGNVPKYMGNYKADLIDDTWEHGSDPGDWEAIIRDGVLAEMPANPDLTSQQVDALVHFMRVLRHEEQPK
jgi:mono/diheme cytochrome c family protein